MLTGQRRVPGPPCAPSFFKSKRFRILLIQQKKNKDTSLHGGIGKFLIPGRPRRSACFCVKARLIRVTSHKEDKQT